MKTIQMKTGRILAMIAILAFLTTSAFASVKVYSNSGYKGKYLVMNYGEYSGKHFYRLLGKSSFCSIKVPKGFCVEVDYYGQGWNSGKISSYSRNVSKLKCGFKKIRIISCGPQGDHSFPGKKPVKEVCAPDWCVQFYSSSSFRGEYACFPSGQHGYKTSFGYPKSIKVKPGYELVCISGGKTVKRLSGSSSSYRGRFDSFKVVKKGGKPGHSRPGHGKEVCAPNWCVQFYSSSSFRGEYACFPSGQHGYKTSFGYPKSIKVKPGYELVCISGGKAVKRLSGSVSSYRGRFDSFKIAKKGNSNSSRKRGRYRGRR